MAEQPRDIATIDDYHAHVYFDPDTRDRAELLRKWVEERFPVRMGNWRDEPVGPHVKAMYQIAFQKEQFPTLVPFLMLNRMGLTILLHPQSGRPRDDHTLHASWMGEVLPVKMEVLRETG